MNNQLAERVPADPAHAPVQPEMKDSVYLRAFRQGSKRKASKRRASQGTRRRSQKTILAGLALAVLLVAITAVVLRSSPDPNPQWSASVSAPIAVKPPALQLAPGGDASSAEQQRLRTRNKRLEALVELLRKRSLQRPAPEKLKFEGFFAE